MRRQATVCCKGQAAGTLTEENGEFTFVYRVEYQKNLFLPPVSLTLPKTQMQYTSPHLFPFFFNMLPEGVNKQLICRRFRIDEQDHFGLLLQVGSEDTIGSVTVHRLEK